MDEQIMRIVTAAVVCRGGKYFIAQRKEGGALSLKWEFPGGKVDEGETGKQALQREMMEELGVEADIGDFFCSTHFIYNGNMYELHAYLTSFSGEPKVLNDHEQYTWVLPEEFSAYDFADSDKGIIDKILQE
ncbi:MAG: (deoxy)nucleoside triphosphate pyrophosphohydrolase [Spirochaetales bacterium]|nr:(deoxy)nucleoside triphosphate pyrophosphohydrolase [Spirochaetales bacterium]